MNNLLTAELVGINITSPFPHEADGIGILITSRRKPLSCGFFTLKISALHHYVGLGKALFGVAGFVKPVCQPCSVRHHDWHRVVGFKTLFTEAIMPNNYAQETTKRNTPTDHVSLKSIFSLLDSRHNLITSSLTIEQAKPLSEHIRGSIIKFQAMVKVEVLS